MASKAWNQSQVAKFNGTLIWLIRYTPKTEWDKLNVL